MSRFDQFILSTSPFLGVSPERLLSLIEKVTLEFKTFQEGETIVSPGMEAQHLLLVLKGAVKMKREPISGIKVSWTLKEGCPIELPTLFSLSLRYVATATALERVDLISIKRDDFRKMYESESIILINLLNTLGRTASPIPDLSAQSILEFCIDNLGYVESAYPVRLESTLARIGELLSVPPEMVANQLDILEKKNRIKWLREEHAILFQQSSDLRYFLTPDEPFPSV